MLRRLLLAVAFLASLTFAQESTPFLSDRIFQTLIAQRAEPVYPEIARSAAVQGDVRLRVLVNLDGGVEEVSPLSGPAMLRDSAIQSVRLWRFRPYRLDGQPVAYEGVVTVPFRI